MTKKYITLLCLVSGFSAATPLYAQSYRIDTTRAVIRDQQGNVIGSSIGFEFRLEGSSYETRMQQIQSHKVAFFTNNIGLTPAEAAQFWPLYNEYFKKREALIERKNKLLYQLSSQQTLEYISDKELKALLDAYQLCIEEDAALQKEYYKKFTLILPFKKVARYYQSDQLFKEMLLQTLSRSRY
ncbi:MAG: hypothetical protein LBB31_04040 [Prevotellaceae bacterium]|jgi:hypothetical protein|nr:hypothetical protein [Prevotellaceae bacterium]